MTRIAAAFALLVAFPALAHPGGHADVAGFVPGLLHPWSSWGHVLPALALGAWGRQMGGGAAWALPGAFLLALAVGVGLGASGIALPGVALAVAASAFVGGAALMAAARPALPAAAVLAGGFALFHGHAHGAGLPHGADGVLFGMGVLLATAALLAIGAAAASALGRPAARPVLRGAGASVAAAAPFLLWGALA